MAHAYVCTPDLGSTFMMPKISLGSSGMLVSRIGLGTVKLGRNQSVHYPAHFELPSDREINELLFLTQELGINLLDTAPAYGSSEERLGKLLKEKRKQAGLIRAYGMSTKTVAGGMLAVDQVDVVMVTYNPIQTEEQSVIAYAQQKNKGILIKKALA